MMCWWTKDTTVRVVLKTLYFWLTMLKCVSLSISVHLEVREHDILSTVFENFAKNETMRCWDQKFECESRDKFEYGHRYIIAFDGVPLFRMSLEWTLNYGLQNFPSKTRSIAVSFSAQNMLIYWSRCGSPVWRIDRQTYDSNSDAC